MNYIELKVITEPHFTEILIAELAEIGFESFLETNAGLNAYIQSETFDASVVKEIFGRYSDQVEIKFDQLELESKNWNEEWEKNYEAVRVDDICLIRASFHASENFPYEIIINPKMSFGTGHHETTYLMIKNQLKVSHVNKKVLDVGCGTGILAIMAARLGAFETDAIDIDEWAVENARENFELNGCGNIRLKLGTINSLSFDKKYDIVLANINRNVLLKEIPEYAKILNEDGFLLVSGFYEQDSSEISNSAMNTALKEIEKTIKNHWASIIFQKII